MPSPDTLTTRIEPVDFIRIRRKEYERHMKTLHKIAHMPHGIKVEAHNEVVTAVQNELSLLKTSGWPEVSSGN